MHERPLVFPVPAMSAVIHTPGMPNTMPSRRPRALIRPARLGIYAFLFVSAAFFLLPLYVMLITSVKPMEEIRLRHLFALPMKMTLEPWAQAWFTV